MYPRAKIGNNLQNAKHFNKKSEAVLYRWDGLAFNINVRRRVRTRRSSVYGGKV